jgi:hypothetical protein
VADIRIVRKRLIWPRVAAAVAVLVVVWIIGVSTDRAPEIGPADIGATRGAAAATSRAAAGIPGAPEREAEGAAAPPLRAYLQFAGLAALGGELPR